MILDPRSGDTPTPRTVAASGEPVTAGDGAGDDADENALRVTGLPPALGIVEVLRAGRSTKVLLAHDAEAGGRVVLKVAVGSSAVAALQREARALAALAHPGVVTLARPATALADEDGQPRAFLATHFREGTSLAEVVARTGRAPERWVRAVIRALLGALGAVHAAGIVHADVTLANCLLLTPPPRDGGDVAIEPDPSLLLLDLGACRFLGEPAAERLAHGTTSTMAPELARGEAPTIASDVYAVGCVAYELLVGRPPFAGVTAEALLGRHVLEAPRPPRELLPDGTVSIAFERALLRSLAKDPQARFASAAELARAIAGGDDGAASTASDGAPAATLAVDDEELRRRLLGRVRTQWIDGVLQRTTDGVIMVRQRLRAGGAAGAGTGPELDAPLVTTEGLRAALERHPLLAVLGEAGHGKTVNLLRLARTLVAEAEAVDGSPVPVVLAVSSWRRQPRLVDWMADELVARHDLSRREARRLLELERLIPLLDGLDHLPLAARLDLMATVRAHREGAPATPIVVTCRTAEYAELGEARPEAGLVELSPLRAEEVRRQLQAAEQSALLSALAGSEQLTTLARTPMFLHVMRVSFRDSPGFRTALTSEAATVSALFEAFVGVAERRVAEAIGPLPDLRRDLARLAQLFARTGRTMLFFEDLQPSALPGPGWRLVYALVSRGLAAGLFTLSIIPPVTFTPLDNGGLETSLGFTLRLAGLSWLVLTPSFALLGLRSFVPRRAPRPTGVVASLGIALAVGGVAAAALLAVERHPMAGFLGFEVGFVGSLVLGLSRRARAGDDDVLAAEEVRWSPRNIRPLHLATLALVTLALLVGFPLLYTTTSGVYMAGAIFCVGLIVLGYRARRQDVRRTPNAGIHRTVRNALSAGTLSFVATTLLFGLSYGLLYGAYVGLTLGVVVALWFGGTDVIHHAVLRVLLHVAGVFDLRPGRHLEAAVDAGLLRRVGNGYMFMHATLSDHLAAPPPRSTAGRR